MACTGVRVEQAAGESLPPALLGRWVRNFRCSQPVGKVDESRELHLIEK